MPWSWQIVLATNRNGEMLRLNASVMNEMNDRTSITIGYQLL